MFISTGGVVKVDGSHHHHHHHVVKSSMEGSTSTSTSGGGGRKLFVFGDSYADTGNLPKMISPSWSQPYGISFPGRPAGRFSDGRVLTDYIASFLGIKSPIPYKYRRHGHKLVGFGMNFAVGGSGVLNTTSFFNDSLPVQIDTFKHQMEEGVFSMHDLPSSTALVVIAGNDYAAYRDNGGTMQGLKTFIPKVIDQLKVELKRLCDMGVGKVVVTNLHPIGCLPSFTTNSTYKRCNTSVNLAVMYHNRLLNQALSELNTTVVTIDLYHAFMSLLNQGLKNHILKPCCEAVSSDYSCGFVDLNGVKKYTVCSGRERRNAFYWDSSHPTQAGWNAVYSFLRPSLRNLLVS